MRARHRHKSTSPRRQPELSQLAKTPTHWRPIVHPLGRSALIFIRNTRRALIGRHDTTTNEPSNSRNFGRACAKVMLDATVVRPLVYLRQRELRRLVKAFKPGVASQQPIQTKSLFDWLRTAIVAIAAARTAAGAAKPVAAAASIWASLAVAVGRASTALFVAIGSTARAILVAGPKALVRIPLAAGSAASRLLRASGHLRATAPVAASAAPLAAGGMAPVLRAGARGAPRAFLGAAGPSSVFLVGALAAAPHAITAIAAVLQKSNLTKPRLRPPPEVGSEGATVQPAPAPALSVEALEAMMRAGRTTNALAVAEVSTLPPGHLPSLPWPPLLPPHPPPPGPLHPAVTSYSDRPHPSRSLTTLPHPCSAITPDLWLACRRHRRLQRPCCRGGARHLAARAPSHLPYPRRSARSLL